MHLDDTAILEECGGFSGCLPPMLSEGSLGCLLSMVNFTGDENINKSIFLGATLT